MDAEKTRALIGVLVVPLVLLNLLGGIVSGVWLAILGQWWPIGYGIFAVIISPFILGLILLLAFVFDIPTALLLEKGRMVAALPLVLLSQLYTYALVTAWCVSVFYLFTSRANDGSFWPLALWSYGVAIAPWSFMAAKDQLGDPQATSPLTVFFAQIAYIMMALVHAFTGASFLLLAIVFGGVMLVNLLVQTRIFYVPLILRPNADQSANNTAQ